MNVFECIELGALLWERLACVRLHDREGIEARMRCIYMSAGGAAGGGGVEGGGGGGSSLAHFTLKQKAGVGWIQMMDG